MGHSHSYYRSRGPLYPVIPGAHHSPLTTHTTRITISRESPGQVGVKVNVLTSIYLFTQKVFVGLRAGRRDNTGKKQVDSVEYTV